MTKAERIHIFNTLQQMQYDQWYDHILWTQNQWRIVIEICQSQKKGELETNGTDSDHSTITKIRKRKKFYYLYH